MGWRDAEINGEEVKMVCFNCHGRRITHARRMVCFKFLAYVYIPLFTLGIFIAAEEWEMAQQAVSSANPVPSPAPIGSCLIPILNKLRGIFPQLGMPWRIDLPQVAVLGSQSSGKSSVLEALVGRDFLPRGSHICTRCPLVLQLVHIPRWPDAPARMLEEWAEFLHIPDKRFYDFSKIWREIQAKTDREAGGNKGVSDNQICLKIFSPNVINITLVDLPGITKIPVGDQPSYIEAKIRAMILSFIKHETCIILAVTPANTDLSKSDALQMARIADPDGSRTIGVITKLDIMDEGTDAQNFLLGNVIPLRLGYVGVVNRSQEDINLNRSIKDALANEEAFFRRQPVYHGLSHCCGVPKLAKKLNQILVQHIRSVLPGLESCINSQLVVLEKEHAAYVDGNALESVYRSNILTKYCEAFTSMIEKKNEKLPTAELYGGARIHYIFQSSFVKSLEEVDPCENVSDEDIRMTIQNATDPKAALFLPEVPFEVLVRSEIGHLLDPSLQCAKSIYDELIKMRRRCLANELRQYPFLRKRMYDVIGNWLRERLQIAETMITQLIEMEMGYINTSHPDFIGENKAREIAQQEVKASRLAASVSRPEPSENQSEQEALEISITKLLLKSYYDIVRKKFEHNVPLAIMHFLVNHTKRELDNVLIEKLYREKIFDDMLREPDDIAATRKMIRETLGVLQQAYKMLEELPLEADTVEKGYSLDSDSTGLPKV